MKVHDIHFVDGAMIIHDEDGVPYTADSFAGQPAHLLIKVLENRLTDLIDEIERHALSQPEQSS